MENQIIAISLLLTLTLLTLHILKKIFPQKKLNPPPGPKPWPVIGNLNLIGPLPHRSIHQLSLQYGPVMLLKLGSLPVVVASSADAAKIFLKEMDLTFASRPKTSAGKYLTYNYSDVVWSDYGPYWRQARKIFLMELFSARRLESYEYIRAEEMGSLVKEIFGLSGRAFSVKDSLSTMSLNVICRMVLGRRYLDGGGVAVEEFKEMLDELFLLTGVLNVGDMIPCINFLDLQRYVKRMKVLSEKFDGFLENVLDEHEARRRETTGYASRDMVDVLLELAEDPMLDVKVERHGVKAFTLVCMITVVEIRYSIFKLIDDKWSSNEHSIDN